jgi:excinuclease UvrABC ATPase subunit
MMAVARVVCPTCHGEGATDADWCFLDGEECQTCEGEGFISVEILDAEETRARVLRVLRRWETSGVDAGDDVRELVGLLKLLLGSGLAAAGDPAPGHLETISRAAACLEEILDQHT